MLNGELSRAMFSRKKYQTLSDISQVNNLYTTFELYNVEVMKEFFKELRGETPLRLLTAK